MSDFFHWYIIAITVASILGMVWLIWWTRKLPASEESTEHTTGHVWDEDIEEGNYPLPRWWLGLFYLTIIFSVIYLILYPGLGKFPGLLNWTSSERYASEVATADKTLTQLYEQYDKLSLAELGEHEAAMGTAKRLFLNYCGQCHGSDGAGRPGFPNLRDDDWLYGGDEIAVMKSIAKGRQGIMPAMGAALDSAGREQLVDYILKLSGQDHDTELAAKGSPLFTTYCAGCHGIQGTGNSMIGAPNLTDSIWLYGGNVESVTDSIVNGRSGNMPAHNDLLKEAQIRLLTAYLLQGRSQ